MYICFGRIVSQWLTTGDIASSVPEMGARYFAWLGAVCAHDVLANVGHGGP